MNLTEITEDSKEIIDADDFLPAAPLTSGSNNIDPMMKFRFGRRTIKIPLSEATLNETTIKEWLPHVMQLHAQNASDYRHLHDVYCGKGHIWEKERPFDDKANTVTNENHAFYMVNFKKGQMYGNGIKYSCTDDSASTDDIYFLNRYVKEQYKSTKNIGMAENVYIAGNAYQLILPRAKSSYLDLHKVSPFEIINLKNETAMLVYSSNFTGEPLFGAIVTTIDSPSQDKVNYEMAVYDKYWCYTFRCNSLCPVYDGVKFVKKQRHYIGHVPIVEFYANEARLGVVEIVETLLDAANGISSYSVDNIVDYVNSILAIYNMEITKEIKEGVDKARAIQLITTDPSRPADAKYLVNALDHGDVNTKYEALIKTAYSIAGVPMPTTQSTSSGDTGEARSLGGGWEAANVIANSEELCFELGERKCLEIALQICHSNPSCPVNELYACDIDINFNRTRNYNMLVKTQSLQTLIGMNMPKEIALNIVGLTGNDHEVALAWEEYDSKKQTEMQKKEPNLNE